jgi:hypothetical protein
MRDRSWQLTDPLGLGHAVGRGNGLNRAVLLNSPANSTRFWEGWRDILSWRN